MADSLQAGTSTKVLSFFIGGIVSIWITLGVSVQILLILMALDFMCGIMLASRNGKLSSAEGVRGVTKKAGVLIVLMVAYILQYLAEHVIGAGFAMPIHVGSAVAVAYCVLESVSIIENCHSLGAPIPTIFSTALKRAVELTSSENPAKDGPK